MLKNLSDSELISRIHELDSKLEKASRISALRGEELKALMKGAKAVLESKGFQEAARSIFDHCKKLIGAASGYVALLNETGQENEVLFLDSGGLPCDVNPELPMPIRGLRADAYLENKAVYHNDFMRSPWVRYMPKGHVVLKNVMFAPLVIGGKTVGIIGLANKPGDFDQNDAMLATGFGELAAIALQNSRDLDERNRAEKEREKLIVRLQKALADVKKLSGLLPICSFCKQIRDDHGYWKQIESYIKENSDADFSHSICPECAEKHYPEIGIYDDD
jgi:hypothetical protein